MMRTSTCRPGWLGHAAFLILLLVAPALALAEEIEIVESWPSCKFERLGDLH